MAERNGEHTPQSEDQDIGIDEILEITARFEPPLTTADAEKLLREAKIIFSSKNKKESTFRDVVLEKIRSLEARQKELKEFLAAYQRAHDLFVKLSVPSASFYHVEKASINVDKAALEDVARKKHGAENAAKYLQHLAIEFERIIEKFGLPFPSGKGRQVNTGVSIIDVRLVSVTRDGKIAAKVADRTDPKKVTWLQKTYSLKDFV